MYIDSALNFHHNDGANVNNEIIDSINKLVLNYENSKDESLLRNINRLLRLLEYQSWYLKARLGIIDSKYENFEDDQLKKYEKEFSYSNAFSKYHLIIPLLMYLFKNYNNDRSALEISSSFMEELKDFLRPGDYAKTKTGAQRFITNTRFASNELRKFGMLRSDSQYFFHTWKLSPYGVMIAGSLYYDFRTDDLKKFLDYKLSKDTALTNALKLIASAAEDIIERHKFEQILRLIFCEEVIYEVMKLYDDRFIKFVTLIKNFLRSGIKKETAAKNLRDFLNGLNQDQEISKLADSIKLKKEIDYNMHQFYSIINNSG